MTTYAREPEPENDAALVAHMLGDAVDQPQNATASTLTNVEAEDLRKRVALAEQPERDFSIDSPSDASENASVPALFKDATITLFATDGPTLSKRFTLGTDGRLVKDGSACVMSSGMATRRVVNTAAGLAKGINTCRPQHALCVGRFADPAIEKVKIVSVGWETPGAITRTKENFEFADGPGWCLIDADGVGAADVFGALCGVVPELAQTERVLRTSTSFGLRNALTEEPFPSSGGLHIFGLLKDQRDLPRFLEDLHKQLWLAGYGQIQLSADGKMLERSFVDRSCDDVTRLIFEGGPDLGPGLAQEPRRAVPYAGGPLDSRRACPPLSEAETAEYRRLVDEAKSANRAEAERVRADWEAEHVKARMAKGMSEDDARVAVRHITDGGELDLNFELHFDRLGVVMVWEVLANPKKYIEQPMADPIEGVAYGRGTAKLYREPGGQLWIKSFAHGGCKYTLPAPERESAKSVFGDMDDAEREAFAEAERIRAEKAAKGAADRKAKEDAEAAEKAAKGAEDAKPKQRVFFGADLAKDMKSHLANPLIAKWYNKNTFILMTGEPKKGKTFAALTMNDAVSEGGLWAGVYQATKGLAVYFAGEGGRGIKYRTLAHTGGRSPQEKPFALIPGRFSLMDTKGVDQVLRDIETAAKVSGFDPTLVNFDTLNRGFGGENENDGAAMGKFVQGVDRIRAETGGAVMVLHHDKKAGSKGRGGGTVAGGRGHSALRGAYDTALGVADGKIRVIEQRDLDPNKTPPVYFKLVEKLVGPNGEGIMVPVGMAEVSATVFVGGDEPDEVPSHLKPTYDALYALTGSAKHGVLALWDDWMAAVNAARPARKGGPNKLSEKTMMNHRNELSKLGLIWGTNGKWAVQ